MNLILQSPIYSVTLTLSARSKAEQFSRNQSNSLKAQQVYKNTLAVFAVHTFLKYVGWEANIHSSDSWNPIMQSLMNVADLEIPGYGKVECCFVDFNDQFMVIPPEVREDRIAYIAVSLEPSLQSAKLLGFITELTNEQILLSQLQSVIKLPAYLQEYKEKQETQKLLRPETTETAVTVVQKQLNSSVNKLKQWLKGMVEEGWQTLDEVFPPTPSLGFRHSSQLRQSHTVARETLDEGISRVKLLDLTANDKNRTIALILCLQGQSQDLDISVKVCPTNTNNYLPKGLEIFILDQQQETVMHAQAHKTKNIEFRFSGESGEYFSIKACLNEKAQIETFII